LTRSPITAVSVSLGGPFFDGRRLVCCEDEFWRLLADLLSEFRERRPEDLAANTQRVMVSRDAESDDVPDSPISRTLAEQTPPSVLSKTRTPISGVHAGVRPDRAGISSSSGTARARFRMFLVKQAHHSVVCQLDLKGLTPNWP